MSSHLLRSRRFLLAFMKEESKQDKKWLAEFIKASVEMSGWIAVPVVAALFAGQWLDEKQQTGNLYFLSLTGLAFIISCIGLALTGKRYLAQVENKNLEDKKESKQIDGNGANN